MESDELEIYEVPLLEDLVDEDIDEWFRELASMNPIAWLNILYDSIYEPIDAIVVRSFWEDRGIIITA